MKKKKEEQEIEEKQEEETINDKLDLLKFAVDIKLRLKNDITSDFTLARLGEKDKEGIIEMTTNAYYSKKLMTYIEKKHRKWKWNKQQEEWEQEKLDETEKAYIRKIGEKIFDNFMTRIYMTAILNRNVKDNHLIRILAGYQEQEEGEGIENEQKKEEIKMVKELKKNNEEK